MRLPTLVLVVGVALGLGFGDLELAEAGRKSKSVDWSEYIESPSDRKLSVTSSTPDQPAPNAKTAKKDKKAKAKRTSKARARTKAKRNRRK